MAEAETEQKEITGPGARRAAALLVGLGSEVSRAVFKQLKEPELRRLALGSKDLRQSPAAVDDALKAFVETFDKGSTDGILGDELLRRVEAACVQVTGPITSTYHWQGRIETAQEWQCWAKSRRDRYDEWYRRCQQELGQLVWSQPSIKHSYYKDAAGLVHSLSPWRLVDFWAWTREPGARTTAWSRAPPCSSPNRPRRTTVGQAATISSPSRTWFGRHRPGATASSHQEEQKSVPCGERLTNLSYSPASGIPFQCRFQAVVDLGARGALEPLRDLRSHRQPRAVPSTEGRDQIHRHAGIVARVARVRQAFHQVL